MIASFACLTHSEFMNKLPVILLRKGGLKNQPQNRMFGSIKSAKILEDHLSTMGCIIKIGQPYVMPMPCLACLPEKFITP